MNKTSIRAAQAFVKGERFKSNNTWVTPDHVYLFGNTIARRTADEIILTLCGWNTMTTRNRLNAILSELCAGVVLRSINGACHVCRDDGDPEYLEAHPDSWLRVKRDGGSCTVTVDNRVRH